MSIATFDEIERAVVNAAARWAKKNLSVKVIPLTPDASLRRYFRVVLPEPVSGVSSAVAMWFDSVACPEAAGGTKVDSDQAYVELNRYFFENGIAVPALYLDAREEQLLLIEDLGDTQLASLLLADPRREISALRPLLFLAVDQIVRIQSLPPKRSFFAFERSFTGALYRREMGEFEEFLLEPLSPSEAVRNVVRTTLDTLANRLEAFPRVLAHRDFHAWNLLVHENAIRVIDFQDALLATRPYDLVSLLNDRDMDRLLGHELYRECVDYFVRESKLGKGFYGDYDLALLQRDFKVSGRFAKLAGVRGLQQYAAWIPGTLERIGRTLERLAAAGDPLDCGGLLAELQTLFPAIAKGASQGFRWEQRG